jgi:hypothetical protein
MLNLSLSALQVKNRANKNAQLDKKELMFKNLKTGKRLKSRDNKKRISLKKWSNKYNC